MEMRRRTVPAFSPAAATVEDSEAEVQDRKRPAQARPGVPHAWIESHPGSWHGDKEGLVGLQRRLGFDYVDARLQRQSHHRARLGSSRFGERFRTYFSIENSRSLPKLIDSALKWTGMRARAQANTTRLAIERHEWRIANLPGAFDGFRILHLSDLHIDGVAGLGAALERALAKVPYDACVMTGDYRFATSGDFSAAVEAMTGVINTIGADADVYGVLGNHDCLEMAVGLEHAGMTVLINEGIPLTRRGETLFIAGVDDPHYFETDNLAGAIAHAPAGTPIVLLAHSPELIEEAAGADTALYLCGHSHGGQICMPGGVPALTNSRSARRYVSGRWQWAGMHGYTSRGAGSSGYPARLFCPPEIAVHTLRRG